MSDITATVVEQETVVTVVPAITTVEVSLGGAQGPIGPQGPVGAKGEQGESVEPNFDCELCAGTFLKPSDIEGAYYPSNNPDGFIPQSTADGLYQPLGSYGDLTKAEADGYYYDINNPSGYLTKTVADGYYATGSPDSDFFPSTYKTNGILAAPFVYNPNTNASYSAGRVLFTPIFIPQARTISSLVARVNSISTTVSGRFVLYAANSAMLPETKLFEGTNMTLPGSAGTTFAEVGLNISVSRGWLFAGFFASNSVTLHGMSVFNPVGHLSSGVWGGGQMIGYVGTYNSTPLPNITGSYTGSLIYQNAAVPTIYLG